MGQPPGAGGQLTPSPDRLATAANNPLRRMNCVRYARHATQRGSPALLAAVLVALVDVLALGAPVLIVLGLIVGLGAILSLYVLISSRSHHELLDIARWRAESCSQDQRVAPWWSTVLRTFIALPIAFGVFLSLPLAADAAMGGLGLLPGLVGALIIGVATSGAMEARVTRRWQAASGRRLLVERPRGHGTLEDARFFEMGPSRAAG